MHTSTVAWRHDDVTLSGPLFWPAGQPRGAVLVLPTIANPTPRVLERARDLAALGFVALVADYYGEPARDFDHARTLAGPLRETPEHYRARLGAALAALSEAAPGLPLAAIGFCLGGQAALELARAQAPVRLVASFHGLLDTAAPATAISTRVLVCHGDADPMVPRAQVVAFWEEMDRAGANWHFHAYAGVRHGFTDPASDTRGLPAIGYNASADRQSWAALTGLLAEEFPV